MLVIRLKSCFEVYGQIGPKWFQNEKLTIRISEFLHKFTIAENWLNRSFLGKNPIWRFLGKKWSKKSPELGFSGIVKNHCMELFWFFFHEVIVAKNLRIDLNIFFKKNFVLKSKRTKNVSKMRFQHKDLKLTQNIELEKSSTRIFG